MKNKKPEKEKSSSKKQGGSSKSRCEQGYSTCGDNCCANKNERCCHRPILGSFCCPAGCTCGMKPGDCIC